MNIILAVDGSKSSRKAVEFVGRLFHAQSSGIELRIVYVVPPISHYYYGFEFIPYGDTSSWPDAKAKEFGGQLLDEVSRPLNEAGYKVTAEVLEGDPAETIRRIAEEHNADLIVVGSRGLSAVGGLALGSVSQKLLHRAKCPVLVVR